MVLAAFASELYMKTLIGLEGKAIPRQHNLEKLFGQISAERRSRVEFHWNENVRRNEHQFADGDRNLKTKLPRALNLALSRGAKSFEELRYAYEQRSPEGAFVLGNLPVCLREAIVEIKPEWREITDNPNIGA